MIRLRHQGGALVLEGSGDEEIFGWDHRLFFTAATGYRLDRIRGCYLYSRQEEVLDVLRETVEYLTQEGIQFEADDHIAAMLEGIEQEEREYQQALESSADAHLSRQGYDPPRALIRRLKSYQVQGVQHLLAVKHGANFSVPGSGKTTVIYAAFEALRAKGAVEKLLVIGPRSCFLPWEEEYEACFGCVPRGARLTGPRASRQGLYLESERYGLFLCTYQTAANDVGELISLCRKHRVFMVVDESHNIKRLVGGVWSEAMLRIAPYAARRAILSGTPMPNSYADLWTQITFLWPGKQVLGDRMPYRYRIENEAEHAAIRGAVRPLLVRVTKSELGLPLPTFERVYCDLKPYQGSIYRALSVKFIRDIDAPPEERWLLRQWRKARMVRLIQAASNPALLARYSEEFDIPPLSGEGASVIQLIDEYPRYEVPAKVERATQLVREILEKGEKVVVWSSFVHNIRTLQRLLQDVEVFILYGAVPKDESEDVEFNREQQIRQFKMIARPAVLVANPAACAESISLHKACHHAIYLERTFNCGQYLQSLDRIHRIGLAPDESVAYHLLMANDTIDETIDRRLMEKETNMRFLLEDELPIGTLDVDLHELGQSEDEEAVDFDETMKDIKRQLESADAGDLS